MASGEMMGGVVGVAAAGTWSLIKMQAFAVKAVEEKAVFIRKRLGDQALQVSCACLLVVYVHIHDC